MYWKKFRNHLVFWMVVFTALILFQSGNALTVKGILFNALTSLWLAIPFALVTALIARIFNPDREREHESTYTPPPPRSRPSVRPAPSPASHSKRYKPQPEGNGFVYGTPGDGISQSGFSEDNVKTGTMGEVFVGKALNRFVKSRGGVALHSLYFDPRKKTESDMDHALLFNGVVQLIDAKRWAAGKYSVSNERYVDNNGRTHDDAVIVLRDGKPFNGGLVRVKASRRFYREHFGDHFEFPPVIIAIANQGASVDGPNFQNGVVLVKSNDLFPLLDRLTQKWGPFQYDEEKAHFFATNALKEL